MHLCSGGKKETAVLPSTFKVNSHAGEKGTESPKRHHRIGHGLDVAVDPAAKGRNTHSHQRCAMNERNLQLWTPKSRRAQNGKFLATQSVGVHLCIEVRRYGPDTGWVRFGVFLKHTQAPIKPWSSLLLWWTRSSTNL